MWGSSNQNQAAGLASAQKPKNQPQKNSNSQGFPIENQHFESVEAI
jgi:hypothetical protein